MANFILPSLGFVLVNCVVEKIVVEKMRDLGSISGFGRCVLEFENRRPSLMVFAHVLVEAENPGSGSSRVGIGSLGWE